MDKKQQALFDGLNTLCDTNEAFYFSEQKYLLRYTIRSFSYRLASYSEFSIPFAKDCRGTSFVLDDETGKWEVFTRAYKKFFNLSEGIPKEDYMAQYQPLSSYEKLDGSIIFVGVIGDTLITKSKTSINSEQARLAQSLLDGNKPLQNFCRGIIEDGHTPIFELIGRQNVVVLRYDVDADLVYLGKAGEHEVPASDSDGCEQQGIVYAKRGMSYYIHRRRLNLL
jgi:T4 RnlA family RNA ligase